MKGLNLRLNLGFSCKVGFPVQTAQGLNIQG